MKNFMLTLTAFASIAVLSAFTPAKAPVTAPTWDIDAVHSSVSFTATHFFSDVLGTFDKFDGTVNFSPDDLDGSSVEFTVDVTSVNTKNEKRDKHLQSEDFFNAEKWDTMTFKSSSFKKGKKGMYTVTGDLTIRDVTKTIEVPVKFLGTMAHPMREGTYVAGFTCEFTIDRNDYGVGTGDWAATTVIGDEVDVTVNLEVHRKES